jgi:hypothetical protein
MDEVSVRVTLKNVSILRQPMSADGTGATLAEAVAAATEQIVERISGNGMVLKDTLPWDSTIDVLQSS